MSTPHRATPDQWNDLGAFASDTRACVLELRARIEALEDGATCPHIVSSDEGTSYCRLAQQNAPTTEDFLMGAPNALRAVRNFGREIGAAQIARSADSLPVKNQPATEDSSAPALAGSLVGRLANLLDPDDPICARGTARAAIRKVAKWLDDCCTQAGAEEPSYYDEPTASDAVRWLRQEADRG